MIKFIKKLFFKKYASRISQEESNLEALLPEKVQEEINIPFDRIISKFNKDLPTIVLIDDSKLILSLVEDYLNVLGITNENHNILKFYGMYAPFVMIDTLIELKEKYNLLKVDYAIIDIVLPGKLKKHNHYEKMDGVDVSIILHRDYKCRRMVFFSGNILNVYVDYIKEKIEKFRDYFNRDLRKHILLKSSDDKEILIRLDKLFSEQENDR